MQITTQLVLGDGPFAECGRPTGVYWSRQGEHLAVASRFGLLQWHARDLQAGCVFSFRVSVYEASALRRLAVLDRARFSINDVAFHPSKPLLAIATGSYDGGYFYEGELLLWDLRTGAVVSLLNESREVARCRFDDAGGILQIIMRPRDDGGGEEAGEALRFFHTTIVSDAWELLEQGSVVAEQLPSTTMLSHDGLSAYAPQDEQTVERTLQHLALHVGQHYEPRWCVWDITWTAAGEILTVRNNTALERWNAHGERQQLLADARDGVQLFLSPGGDIYVNLTSRTYIDRWTLSTSIERIAPASGERHALPVIDFPALLSMSKDGALLVRDTDPRRLYGNGSQSEDHTLMTTGPEGFRVTVSHRPAPRDERSRDRVVCPETAPSMPPDRWQLLGGVAVSNILDLGHYDLFNHYLRIDGAPHLYFIAGIPPKPWEERWVRRLDPTSLQVEHLFPVEWKPSPVGHLHVDTGAYLHDTMGESLVLACHRTDARGLLENGTFLVRRTLEGGALLWATSLSAPATALVVLPHRHLVICALRDGHVAILSALTGTIGLHEPTNLDGVSCVYLSLAAHDDRIAAGLVDGRIIIRHLTL
jgi:hypothetical protein